MDNWFIELFTQGSVAQTILLLSIISVIGLALGRIKIAGISFGGSFVFFAAIAVGHFAGRLGIETNAAMMDLAKNFGLVVFVYTLGLQCGPGFFSSLRKGGLRLILCSTGVILLGSAIAVAVALGFGIEGQHAVGLLSGAVTNTPALIAAQQTVLDMDPTAIAKANDVGAAYAVAYPFSVLTVILCVLMLSKMFPASLAKGKGRATDKYTAVTELQVCKQELFDRTVRDIVGASDFHFVISRIWHGGQVEIPVSDSIVRQGDHLLVICAKEDIHRIGGFFGHEEATDWNRPDIDWNIIDKNLISRHVRVTKADVVGISLDKLKLRNKYGVNITRINRAGITLVPEASTMLQFGDRLTVVGDEDHIKALGKAVGNEEAKLNDPHLIPILVGIILGLLLGSIPVAIPGISTPIKLGIAGGPIIMGILMGAFGPRFNFTTYTTRAANLMLRQFGITFFFASLGFSVGGNFVETVFCMQGLKWAGIAIVMAGLPLFIMGIFNEKVLHLDFAKNVGLLCGAMANPNALNYAGTLMENDSPAESYATVYPITIFLRVFLAQMLIIALL